MARSSGAAVGGRCLGGAALACITLAGSPGLAFDQGWTPSTVEDPPAPARSAVMIDEHQAPAKGLLPVDTRTYLSPTVGYGSGGLGVGVGGRLGTVFANGLSFALSGTYHTSTTSFVVGDSESPPPPSSFTLSRLYGGGEGGYDLNLRWIVLRPYVGVGAFAVLSPQPDKQTGPAFWGGVQLAYDVPRAPLFVAADLRGVELAGSGSLSPVSFGAFGALGVKLGSR